MPVLTEEEAEALDELLTNTTPEVNPNVEGPFIKNYRRGMMVALDQFSAQYLQSRMLATKQTPAELINGMIQEQMGKGDCHLSR
jgi:hypothetical protein